MGLPSPSFQIKDIISLIFFLITSDSLEVAEIVWEGHLYSIWVPSMVTFYIAIVQHQWKETDIGAKVGV